jgi:Tfp pilus assembly protein PilO
VSLTDRDKKILMIVVPMLCLLGYWFLLLSPKRQEASKANEELAKQEERRDTAEQRLAQAKTAEASFARDYTAVVRLGKAIPASVDMPSLIVQLDEAARGTGINFQKIAAGQRDESAGAPSGSSPPAQTAPGQAAQNAQNGAATAEGTNAKRETAAKNNGLESDDLQTSANARPGGLSVGGGAGSTGPAGGGGPAAPGLDTVPLDFEFVGSFFDLADFFHRMKRFVRTANDGIRVRGRLMSIDGLKFTSDEETFPFLKAEVTATVYLSPKVEGATAGATPQGPSQAVPTAGGSSPSSPTPQPASTPTATATP